MTVSIEQEPNSTKPSSDTVAVPTELLQRIMDRLDRMERRLDQLVAPVEQAPALVATAADTADAWIRAASARGMDVDATLTGLGRLAEQLAAPQTLARIEALVQRLDVVEQALDAAEQLPGTLATVGDMVDGWIRRAQAGGVDLDQTLKALLPTVSALADPKVLHALRTLAEHAPQLAELTDQGPKLIATAVDSVDHVLGSLMAKGVDVRLMSESVAVGLSKLSEMLNSPQYRALMNSGVLDPSTLDMVGKAGSALVRARMDACVETGMFGALRATSDKDIQRSIGFAIKFAHAFGEELAQPDNIKHMAMVAETAKLSSTTR